MVKRKNTLAGGGTQLTSQQSAASRHVRKHFDQQFGDTNDIRIVMAPGRVNLIGDHTDYNDGFALPMTINSGVYWAMRARSDEQVRLYSERFGEQLNYSLSEPPEASPGAWTSYVTGVIEELRKRNLVERGFEGVVYGDLPLGTGLSSSAALEVATAIALQDLFGFSLSAIGMIQLCQDVEHTYAGVNCGIMDQFASRLGRTRHALLLDCRSLDYEDVPWSFDDISVVIVVSGVERSLAASRYNERRAECLQGVSFFQSLDEKIVALRDVTPDLIQQHGPRLATTVANRCEHVVMENQRVLQAAECMRIGDHPNFGRLMNESHASLRDLYEVSCDELDMLVSIAQSTDGVHGARMTGGGFGGCTVNLLNSDAVDQLTDNICAEYTNASGLEAQVLTLHENVEAGPLPDQR